MNSSTLLATWFLIPAIGLSLVRVLFRELSTVIRSRKGNPSGRLDAPTTEHFGLKSEAIVRIAGDALTAVLFTAGPTFANVNENWEYAPPGLAQPLPYWWLLFAACAGGTVSGIILVAYDYYRRSNDKPVSP